MIQRKWKTKRRQCINVDDKDNDNSDDGDSPTVEEFLAALLQIQRAAETAQKRGGSRPSSGSGWGSKKPAKREVVVRLYILGGDDRGEHLARRWRCFGTVHG